MHTELNSALEILSAMITPAVLISACSSLVISSSNRLGRIMDRTRRVSDMLEELVRAKGDPDWQQERDVLVAQLDRAARRSVILHDALSILYLALGIFVATSVAIGIVAITGKEFAWVAVALGVVGAGLLFYAAILLIRETRIGHRAVDDEMEFIRRVTVERFKRVG